MHSAKRPFAQSVTSQCHGARSAQKQPLFLMAPLVRWPSAKMAHEGRKMHEEGRIALAQARKQQSAAIPLPPPPPLEVSNAEDNFADLPAVPSPPRRKSSALMLLKSKIKLVSPVKRKSSALQLLKSKMSPAFEAPASFDAAASSSSARTDRLIPVSAVSTTLAVLRGVIGFKRAVRVAPDTAAEEPQPSATAPSSIAEVCTRLSAANKDEDWTVRNAALLALPSLIAPLASQPEAMRTALDALGAPLVLALSDLRSALVRSACDACRELATAHGRAVAPLIAHVLPQVRSICQRSI